MARYQIILAYDGTHFVGFQRQRAGSARTVQGEVETSLHQLGWQGRSILAAGRTDTGVHASGQVIAFDLEWQHSPGELCQALNASLPEDVAAQAVKPVQPGFHPRYDALARRYRYHLFCQVERDPLRERFTWRVWPAVELARLQAAATLMVGEHDFSAFGTPPRPNSSPIRAVWQAEWQQSDAGLRFEVTANAFLYHMVRRMVFIQVLVGQGKLALEDVRRGLETGISPAPGMAPAHGLMLTEVMYSL
jgi:tRNA pseudouridine38-40 synthase